MCNHLTNDYADYLLKDGIVYMTYKKKVYIDLKAAILVVKDRLRIQHGMTYSVLCDARGILYTNKPARDYLAVEGSTLITALAYIADKPYTKMVTDFYIKVSRPTVSSQQVFEKISDARSYLNQFL